MHVAVMLCSAEKDVFPCFRLMNRAAMESDLQPHTTQESDLQPHTTQESDLQPHTTQLQGLPTLASTLQTECNLY